MDLLDKIAEARLKEALEQGVFDNLPGAGKPLTLDDDSAVPKDLRVAYRILKNAGFLPPTLQVLHEIRETEQLLLHVEDTAERSRALQRLHWLRAQMDASDPGRSLRLQREDYYYQKVIERLDKE
ncbi:MAG: DUF1992 domain-containing protein [Gammaproteobacteria bacterium]|nr:DUF1992 domain-containing protein [Gammaproteobacteria bacterium]MCP5458062.1 DUF1992 domain-containing protein [Gammaproteobacteria bacterium]